MQMDKQKLGDIATVEISGVDKKTKDGEQEIRLCNFVDVYYNWAITTAQHDGFMFATARPNEISKFQLKKGQVALTKDSETRDDIGVPTYIADDFDDVILGYHCALITPNKDILDGRYLNALLHTDYAKKYFACNASGSGQRYALSVEALNSFPVPMIPLRNQERIGEIFSALDKKIELNRRINQNLEAMAKQLYDYWFVQFDFPNENGKPYKSSGGKMVWNEKLKREIPKGWNVLKLGEHCSFNKRTSNGYFNHPILYLDTSNITNNTIDELQFLNPSSDIIPSRARRLVQEGDIVYSTVRPNLKHFGIIMNPDYNMVVSTGFAVITANWSAYRYFIYQFLIQAATIENLSTIAQSAVSAYPSINTSDIENLDLVVPPDSMIEKYAKTACRLYLQIDTNYKEIKSLTKQRDELLPLLMNGQVSVNSDLAVSYIIYKNKIIRIMKENIIQAIVAKMQRDLDCRQMARLKAVLTSELHNVEIIEKSDCATQQTQENEHLLNSFISAKKIEGCSDKTLTYYRNTIERLLVTLSLAICHITTTDIRTYLSDYQEEHQSSKVTIDNMRRIFSSFFAWLEDEDYIAKSPVRRIHKVKTDSLVKEVLSDEQLEQLRDSCTTKRDLAIIDFLSSTGIRVGELVKLSREDIDFHERQCVVFGKGNKERVVYFNARTKLHLQQYLNERTDSNPALFVSLNSPHSRLTISGVEVRIRKMGQALSMPKVHPHKFRRTLATMAIDKGMPIEQVQRLLGHVRIDTTLHYAIVNQNNVKLAHKKYLG